MVDKIVVYGLSCTCHEDGVRYIGQTIKGMKARFYVHLWCARKGQTSPVYNWIRKHGEQNIKYEIIEVCTLENLDEREEFWIAQYRQTNNLTNILSGGKQPRGHKKTPEQRAAMSGPNNPMYGTKRKELMDYARSFQGPISEETRAKRAAASRGRKHSEETKAKIGKGISAAFTEDRKKIASKKMSGSGNPRYGTKLTEEQRHALSMAKTKLTEDNIREIRRLRTTGLLCREIAERFDGVSEHTVSQICSGRKYSWIV